MAAKTGKSRGGAKAKSAAKPRPKGRSAKPARAKRAAKKPARRASVAKSRPAKRSKTKAKPARSKARPAAKRATPAKKSVAKPAAKSGVSTKAGSAKRPGAAVRPVAAVHRTRPASSSSRKTAAQALTLPSATAPPPTKPPTRTSVTVLRPQSPAARAQSLAGAGSGKPVDLAAIRLRLSQKKEDIEAMYRADLRTGQESNDSPTEDIVDRANNAYHRELSYSLSDSERSLLFQVDEALARLDAGAYGRCVQCGEPIAALRLEALPWAKHCINCQELLEKGLLSES